jgi:hypothetical protein
VTDRSITQRLLFPDTFLKPVVAQFDQDLGSSDGGAEYLPATTGRSDPARSLVERGAFADREAAVLRLRREVDALIDRC